MRRMIYGLVAVLVLWALPQMAAAEDWTISVHGGASVPTGDFASKDKADAQTGWAVGGSIDYPWKDVWAFGVDGSWNQNANGAEGETTDLGGGTTSSLDEDKFKTWQIGAHAKYFFPTSSQMPVKWYGMIGAGLYGFTEDVTETFTTGGTSTTTTTKATDKRAGMKLGLGGTWWANAQVGVNMGLDYNVAFLDKDSSPFSSLQYVGAYAGMTFKFPTAE